MPAHFPRDDWALARFDGTALYEHADPRRGEHPDWGTLVFNFGRNEVRNFLVANALYWVEEFHIDGLRVDAVASMLYLDYSRRDGRVDPQPVRRPREPRGRSPSCASSTRLVHGDYPGVIIVAEESTAWPGVSRPDLRPGGSASASSGTWAGCTTPWTTCSKDPVYRRYHHHQLTFGLLYAWSENFVLPLSHDEVVHGKGSLLGKMPGDRWQQFANLRALLRAGCGRIPARSCSSWAASSASGRSGPTSGRSTGTCSTTPSTAGCSAWSRTSAPATWRAPPSGSATTDPRASAGSTPATATRTS